MGSETPVAPKEIGVASMHDVSHNRSRIEGFWRRYKKNRAALFGLITILFFLSVAFFAPSMSPYNPYELTAESLSAPSQEHLMGTDDLGRDIYSQVLWGARTSLIVGFIAASISLIIGVFVGSISGYYGGLIDDVLMRFTDFILVIPRFILALVIAALFGSSIINVILIISILAWPSSARLIRSEFLTLREQEFVDAARVLGASSREIIFSEILPNALPPAIVNGTLQIATAILLEAGLSFLGLGDPNTISWGYILNNAQRSLMYAWWTGVFPGLAIFFIVLGFNLVGDGLNDALNPKLRD